MHKYAWIPKLYLVEKNHRLPTVNVSQNRKKNNTYMCLCVTHKTRKRRKIKINTEIWVLVKSTEGRGKVIKSENAPRDPQN